MQHAVTHACIEGQKERNRNSRVEGLRAGDGDGADDDAGEGEDGSPPLASFPPVAVAGAFAAASHNQQ